MTKSVIWPIKHEIRSTCGSEVEVIEMMLSGDELRDGGVEMVQEILGMKTLNFGG